VTLSGHQGADAEQAAYFRDELHATRRLLLAETGKRRPLIDRQGEVSQFRQPKTNAEAELRHIEWSIARLESRFALGGDEPN
jgi:hypothetical protein